MKKTLLLALVLCLALSTSAFALLSGGPHDLTSNGQGQYGATVNGVAQLCVYCHHPHNTGSAQLLWNMDDVTTETFTMYSSPFAQSTSSATIPTGTPDGAGGTGECMSCHDGYIASTATIRGGDLDADVDLSMQGNLGTDLSDDHPVGFDYSTVQSADPELESETTATGNGVVFFGGNMGCASCHDVHNYTLVPFLRLTLNNSTLCTACHIK